MRLVVLAALGASLAACSALPIDRTPETVPAALTAPMPPSLFRPCPPLDMAVAAEAERMTSIGASGGDTDALTAALLRSEAVKNARLRQVLLAYDRCRARRS